MTLAVPPVPDPGRLDEEDRQRLGGLLSLEPLIDRLTRLPGVVSPEGQVVLDHLRTTHTLAVSTGPLGHRSLPGQAGSELPGLQLRAGSPLLLSGLFSSQQATTPQTIRVVFSRLVFTLVWPDAHRPFEGEPRIWQYQQLEQHACWVPLQRAENLRLAPVPQDELPFAPLDTSCWKTLYHELCADVTPRSMPLLKHLQAEGMPLSSLALLALIPVDALLLHLTQARTVLPLVHWLFVVCMLNTLVLMVVVLFGSTSASLAELAGSTPPGPTDAAAERLQRAVKDARIDLEQARSGTRRPQPDSAPTDPDLQALRLKLQHQDGTEDLQRDLAEAEAIRARALLPPHVLDDAMQSALNAVAEEAERRARAELLQLQVQREARQAEAEHAQQEAEEQRRRQQF